MFQIVVTGPPSAQKHHAQTLDGRRLCSCKYRVAKFTYRSARLGTGWGCDASSVATQTLPTVHIDANGSARLGAPGLGCSLYARDLGAARELVQKLGWGAYRRTDGDVRRTARVLTIAEREEQRSIAASNAAARRYWGD
jgi:hypothetical protein